MGMKLCRRAHGTMGMVHKLKQNSNSPGHGDITKELTWTFDIDYVSNRTLYLGGY